MSFLRRLWLMISHIKNAIGNIVFLSIITILFFALFQSRGVKVQDGSALVLNPKGSIVEQKSFVNPLGSIISGNRTLEVSLQELLTVIKDARSDGRIALLVLDLARLGEASIGHLEEIGIALQEFKSSGKTIIAVGSSYTQTQYYLASFADEIILEGGSLNPLGGVMLTGLSIHPLYYKTLLDKLDLDFRVFAAGEYKDAVEPYLRDGMSEIAKIGNQQWLDSLWETYKNTILKNRQISSNAFHRYTNDYDQLLNESGDDPDKLALDYGFVDKVLDPASWKAKIISLVGASGNSFRQVTYIDYLGTQRNTASTSNQGINKIAVITASGTILEGDQPAGFVGSDSIVSLIEKVRMDDNIRALVFRINSPGGSAGASEEIRRELELVQKEGKPVVVSMGGYATSGGYWISSTANKIFALESTITGSIGVFMVFRSYASALSKLGVNGDGLGTTNLSGAFNPLKPINPILEDALERSVNRAYSRFLNLVSDGRNMTVTEAKTAANGKVWTGKKALALGLIDAIGDLDDAVSSAAVLSGISQYEVVFIDLELSASERLANELFQIAADIAEEVYVNQTFSNLVLPREIQDLLAMSESPSLQSYCPYCRVK
ncbi:MAG: signal peptide peptidase SppA [Gammaproteobacteria bacterium TMED1]|nr:MAG: signal peptide peptidase SppA [Gammaproteobacteria bacterium TMED1]